jgi:hypothetical protein
MTPRTRSSRSLRAVWVAAGAIASGALCFIAMRGPAAPDRPAGPGPIPPVPVISAAQASSFVGSEACASCHKKEAADHARSLHADTLAPLEKSDAFRHVRFDQSIHDGALGMTYTWRMKDGKPVCRVQRSSDGASEEMTPKYVVGSGHHGYTFLFEKKGVFMESRLSYYPPARRWAWTPGQETETPHRAPMGRVLLADESFSCFICHSTHLVHEGEQALPEQSMFNVGCERCHGPGKEHVEQARAGVKPGHVWGYRNASADTVMKLCGECHRSPGAIPDEELDAAPDLARFAGTALAASKCYRQSEGRLSCLSCHNPHTRVSTDRAAYDRVCQGCHTGQPAAQKLCPVNRTSDCVSCHMPTRHMPDPPEVKFHNHFIKVYPPPRDNREVAQTGGRAPAAPGSPETGRSASAGTIRVVRETTRLQASVARAFGVQ